MGMVFQDKSFHWKDGSHIHIDAQAAGEEMESLRVRHNNRLEPNMVVEAARKPGSALHDHFDWDDTTAANKYRLGQAGHLIRCITVEVTKSSGETAPVRAFVSVKRDEDRSYTSVQHALADDDLRAQVLSQAWQELEAWRKRHAELIELAKVFAVIDQARLAI